MGNRQTSFLRDDGISRDTATITKGGDCDNAAADISSTATTTNRGMCSARPLFDLFRRPSALLTVDRPATGGGEEEDDDGEESSSSSLSSSRGSGSCGGGWSPPITTTAVNAPPSFSYSNTMHAAASSSGSLVDILEYTPEELRLPETSTKVSDLSRPNRHVWIVTTACLPWMTGTAVNPLLRAAALCSPPYNHHVTLVVPWLEQAYDRVTLYGDEWEHATPEFQTGYLRRWLKRNGHAEAAVSTGSLVIDYYPARYHEILSSIFAMGDICERIRIPPAIQHDAICLIEEPEHINYYGVPGVTHWRDIFSHVVGIVHTNYKAYAQQKSLIAAPIVGAISAWMVQAYCDKVIKLSPVLQQYAIEKEVVCNVHGIRDEFLADSAIVPTGKGVYFLGKLLWAKGLDKLLELLYVYKRKTGKTVSIDIFGSGPEEAEIKRAYLGESSALSSEETKDENASHNQYAAGSWASRLRRQYMPLPVTFKGRQDHAVLPSSKYKIFVNPSITEVLCTVTAEAVARGRFVIIPQHSSNEYFYQFPNCLAYRTPNEFVACLEYACEHNPQPLSTELRNILTWEAATRRLLEAAAISQRDAARQERLGSKQRDNRLAQWHRYLSDGPRGDTLRKLCGGGPVAFQHEYCRSVSVSTASSSSENLTDKEEKKVDPPEVRV